MRTSAMLSRAHNIFDHISILRYQRLMTFYKALPLNQLYSLCMMSGMHFDNVSVLLSIVAAAYVYSATSSVTTTCCHVYTAKLEIHTLFK